MSECECVYVCITCSLKMLPSLDIYSFGMVVIFLFSEKNWWPGSPPRSPDITAREQQVNTMIGEMEGMVALQGIAQQVSAMLHPDAKRRPKEVTDCSFKLNPTYHDT